MRISRGVRRASLVAAIMALSTVIGSSTALAVRVWSGPDSIDPSIDAQAVSCPSASFCMAVGFTSAFGSAAVYSNGTWSEASLIDPGSQFFSVLPVSVSSGSQLFSVSCTSSSFCMALDGSGEALVYDGSTWSTPTPAGSGLTYVSCISPSFCVAVGGSGESATYNGSSWSALSNVGVSLSSVSCSSKSLCIAIGESGGGPAYALTYDGSGWSAPTEIDSERENALHSLSCVSSSFCVTVGNLGYALLYSGSTWSKPTKVGIRGYIQSVSCHSESFCVAVAAGGEAATYDGSTWRTAGEVSEAASSGALACPTDSFCLAVGGYSSTYDGSSWTSAVPVGGGALASVSCSSSSLCTAVDYHGRALTYNGSTWSAPTLIDAEGGLRSVSCPVASFCMAVGGYPHGHALTYNCAAWSSPSEVNTESSLDSVSCVSASFCGAIGTRYVEGHEHGYAVIYNNGVWGAPSEIAPEAGLGSVSCASESLCVAVGSRDALVYDGSTWSTPSEIYPEGSLHGVSCLSSSFCVAVAERFTSMGALNSGQALTYNGVGWSGPSEIPNAPDRGPFVAGSVSCASSTFCMTAARFEGAVSIFEGGAWSAWNPFEVNADPSSVSCPSTLFCVMVNGLGQAFTYSALSSTGQSSGDGSSGPVATTSGEPATNPPTEKGRAHINRKTGEITLEYDFPEPGQAEAYGEAITGTASSRSRRADARVVVSSSNISRVATRVRHGKVKKCRGTHLGKARNNRCAQHALIRYGRVTLTVARAGSYKFRIKPSDHVLTMLRADRKLMVRLTVIFTPASTANHIRETTEVRPGLIRGHQSKRRLKARPRP